MQRDAGWLLALMLASFCATACSHSPAAPKDGAAAGVHDISLPANEILYVSFPDRKDKIKLMIMDDGEKRVTVTALSEGKLVQVAQFGDGKLLNSTVYNYTGEVKTEELMDVNGDGQADIKRLTPPNQPTTVLLPRDGTWVNPAETQEFVAPPN